eukprot:2262602-Amphidinium_carterae.2
MAPGNCYDIIVEGWSNEEGAYTLSVTCEATIPLACGTVFEGSTSNSSSSGGVWHGFCPNVFTTAMISACGTQLDSILHVLGPDVDMTSTDDGSCSAVLVAGMSPESCYDIVVGGYNGTDGGYNLSVTCNESMPVTCGMFLQGSIVGQPSHIGHPSGEA